VREPLSQRAIIGSAIFLIALVGVSLSLFIPLLSIIMERSGTSATLSGLNTATAGLGTLCVAPFVPRLAIRFGIQRIIFVSIITCFVVTIGFWLLPFWAWFPLRFIFGAAIGTLFVLSEYWINTAAPPDKRGIVMGIYATMLSIGFVTGPLILTWTRTAGIAPFAAGACIYLLAIIPLYFARGVTPEIESGEKTSVFPFMIAVPTATFAGLVFGAVETGGFALFPVYGLRNAMPETTAAILISVVAAGNIISQIPIGWLSDHMDRRWVLLMCAFVGVAGSIAMPFALMDTRIFLTVLFIWGGFTGGLYTVGLAHLGARFRGTELANANAAFVMLYSIGLVIGPPLVGFGMDKWGLHGFAISLGLMLAAYSILISTRIAVLRMRQ
jgi:MFS family permease